MIRPTLTPPLPPSANSFGQVRQSALLQLLAGHQVQRPLMQMERALEEIENEERGRASIMLSPS